MSDEKNKDDMLETTTEIRQGHADIGKFNIAIEIILTIICITYLVTHFSAP
ncbi:MAG: hypothetical protein JXR25_08980 [Pontiellaceae bacterium]|nr:hypothetical protein [Pontiellaceae bacterium]MBN2784949.1 hypothetical protein [Pontiellaceae bacterium]